MVICILKWYLRVVRLLKQPVYFPVLVGFVMLSLLAMPNGRIHGDSLDSSTPLIHDEIDHSFYISEKPNLHIKSQKKEKPVYFTMLNQAKLSTRGPAWQRPLPVELSAPLLNERILPLPEVTSGTLIIPALNLEEPIIRVLVVNGYWDVSGLNTQVGHLQTTGERPGDGLAMTFVGHTSWPGSGPFADLIQLRHGEQIIYRWNGYDYIYQIDRMMHVLPTQVGTLYEENGEAIVLATCSGWNPDTSQYDTRLITRATLIEKRLAPPPVRTSLIL